MTEWKIDGFWMKALWVMAAGWGIFCTVLFLLGMLLSAVDIYYMGW